MRIVFTIAGCICAAQLTWAQGANPFTLTTPDEIELNGQLETIVALKTARNLDVQLSILDTDGRRAGNSPRWKTKAGESYAEPVGTVGTNETRKLHVQLAVFGVRDCKELGSIETLITQGNANTIAARVANLKRIVQDATFTPDPAHPPKGGEFHFDLGAPASVQAQIWQGDPKNSAPKYSAYLTSLAAGASLGWDLKDNQKRLVQSGCYTALLNYRSGKSPAISRMVSFLVMNP
jgi:hypothetical protein